MGLFHPLSPLEKEWALLQKQEARFLARRAEQNDALPDRTLAQRVPPKLQGALDAAFIKAFSLVFEKGTGVIEKTYRRTQLEQDSQVARYAVEVKGNRTSIRAFQKKAAVTGARNLLLSGLSGVGLGAFGIGLPDIPLLTGLILKNIYEIALRFGYGYETEEERYFILLLLQGAAARGEAIHPINEQADTYIFSGRLPPDYDRKVHIQETATLLSRDLLYMKFLQGIPLVGAVGGAYDAVFMKRITHYATLKYRRRFLTEQKRTRSAPPKF